MKSSFYDINKFFYHYEEKDEDIHIRQRIGKYSFQIQCQALTNLKLN